MLETFARNPNDVFSSQELIRITHSNDEPGLTTEVAVRSMIHSLRRKMGNYILNIRGIGYRLIVPEINDPVKPHVEFVLPKCLEIGL